MKVFSFFALLLFCLFAHSQSPLIEWQKCFGGGQGDYAHSIENTTDGGYIIAGYTESTNGDVTASKGTVDFWIVKITASGAIQWQKNMGGRSWDRAAAIRQLPDGGYIVAGSASSNDGDLIGKTAWGMDFWVIKLTATGNVEWQKNYGGSKSDYLYGMDITKDGGYILAGSSESADGDVAGSNGEYDIWILKINKTGVVQWKKRFGGSGEDAARSVVATDDGGYVVVGETRSVDFDMSGNHGNNDMWVAKLSSDGTTEWQKCFGGSSYEGAWDVKQTPDGNYLVAGFAGSNNGDVSGNHDFVAEGFTDFWLVKLNKTGAIQWQKCYGGGFNEIAYSIDLTRDGGFVVAGSAESANGDATCNAGWYDYWVIKCSGSGALEWQKSMGGISGEEIYSIKQTPDGGYILAGFTGSPEIPGYHPNDGDVAGDFWIIKLSAQLYGPTKPEISIAIPSTDICAGSPYLFTATTLAADVSTVFQWQLNGVNAGTNSSNYTINSLRPGDVVRCMMTVTTDCGTKTTQVESNSITMQGGQEITPEVIVSATATSVCAGTSITFTATNKSGNPNPSYQWTVNGQNSGTNSTVFTSGTLTDGAVVQCRMTVPHCGAGTTKDDSEPIIVSVKPVLNPSVTIEIPSTIICKGNMAVFTAKAKDGGTIPAYEWGVNGNKVGSNAASFSIDNLKDGDEISCKLLADLRSACSSQPVVTSNKINVKVVDVHPPSISIASSDNNICEGDLVELKAMTQNAESSPSYQWKINGINTASNAPALATTGLINHDEISCTLTVQNGCAAGNAVVSNSIIMQVKARPLVNVYPVDTTVMAGAQIQLQATISGDIGSYNWSPNQYLQNAQSLQPRTLPMMNSAIFKLEAIGINGCKEEKEIKISVVTKLFMPNAFTPDGDGLNDVFRIPLNASIQLKEFSVFDRWGNKVFTTTDGNKGWDGTNKGMALKTDVFVYVIKGNSPTEEIFQKGTVVLVR